MIMLFYENRHSNIILFFWVSFKQSFMLLRQLRASATEDRGKADAFRGQKGYKRLDELREDMNKRFEILMDDRHLCFSIFCNPRFCDQDAVADERKIINGRGDPYSSAR